MDNKNFAIGILSTTAVILLVGLMVIHSRPETTFAHGMTTIGGDYRLTVGRLSGTNSTVEELLYVVDGATKGLNVYKFSVANRKIEMLHAISLEEMRRASQNTQPPPAKKKRRRGRRP